MRFLTDQGAGGCEIHRRMEMIFYEQSMYLSRIQEWSKRFREGRMLLVNDARSAAPSYVTDQHVTKVDEVIKTDCRATVDNIYGSVVLSHDIVPLIIVNTLKFRKLCAQWAPHNST